MSKLIAERASLEKHMLEPLGDVSVETGSALLSKTSTHRHVTPASGTARLSGRHHTGAFVSTTSYIKKKIPKIANPQKNEEIPR